MKLIIERKYWLRGQPDGVLLDNDGKMCCLGFACQALGVNLDDMLHQGTPQDLDLLLPGLTEAPQTDETKFAASVQGKNFLDTDVSNQAVTVNDSTKITDEEREPKIKEILARAGFEVEFV